MQSPREAADGIGVGIVLAAVLVRVGPRLAAGERPRLALVGGGATAGLVVGGLAGAVAAWSGDETLLAGVLAGTIGGLALGGLLALVLVRAREEGWPVAGDRPRPGGPPRE